MNAAAPPGHSLDKSTRPFCKNFTSCNLVCLFQRCFVDGQRNRAFFIISVMGPDGGRVHIYPVGDDYVQEQEEEIVR